jgi:hypothetical protein
MLQTDQKTPRLREHIDMLEAERGESLPEHLMLRILADHIERLEHEVTLLKHRQEEIVRILQTS